MHVDNRKTVHAGYTYNNIYIYAYKCDNTPGACVEERECIMYICKIYMYYNRRRTHAILYVCTIITIIIIAVRLIHKRIFRGGRTRAQKNIIYTNAQGV